MPVVAPIVKARVTGVVDVAVSTYTEINRVNIFLEKNVGMKISPVPSSYKLRRQLQNSNPSLGPQLYHY